MKACKLCEIFDHQQQQKSSNNDKSTGNDKNITNNPGYICNHNNLSRHNIEAQLSQFNQLLTPNHLRDVFLAAQILRGEIYITYNIFFCFSFTLFFFILLLPFPFSLLCVVVSISSVYMYLYVNAWIFFTTLNATFICPSFCVFYCFIIFIIITQCFLIIISFRFFFPLPMCYWYMMRLVL